MLTFKDSRDFEIYDSNELYLGNLWWNMETKVYQFKPDSHIIIDLCELEEITVKGKQFTLEENQR